jgi:predicted PurR-regulated permease PerM
MSDEPTKAQEPVVPVKAYPSVVLLAMLAVSMILAGLLLWPFVQPIVLALLLASLFHPLKARLAAWYRGREGLAALTTVAIITVVIVVPIILFLSVLLGQGVESVGRFEAWLRQGGAEQALADPRLAGLMDWVRVNLPFIHLDRLDVGGVLAEVGQKAFQQFLSRGASLVSDATTFLTHFFLMIFLTYYFLKDGRRYIVRLKYLSPLPDRHEDLIFAKVQSVASSVLVGSFLTALCQGAAGGLGLALVGIAPLFWGAVMAVTSLIPMVGTALVWVPAVVYLLLVGRWSAAVFLALWSVVLVGGIDNFLRPYFMKGRAELSPFFIFLAIIGGVQYFGLIGILYGPLIVSLAAVMLYIYEIEFGGMLNGAVAKPAPPAAPKPEG